MTTRRTELAKPLFIPLHAHWFDQFAAGTKTTEYRKFGGRWNANTCYPGRPVLLSNGYSKRNRLSGEIAAANRVWAKNLPDDVRRAVKDIFGTDDIALMAITMRDLKKVEAAEGGQ